MDKNGRVKVHIEKHDEKYCFRHEACYLPDYTWKDVYQFSNDDIKRYEDIIKSVSHLILEFARE